MTNHSTVCSACLAYIDAFAEFTGRVVSLLTLVMMILTCATVVLRYGFSMGSIYLQESVGYLHAIVFMLAMAYTLKRDGHVRVDIFYRRFTFHQQAWVNALGSILFLLPIAAYIVICSWDYVVNAWIVREGSPNAGGIPLVYLLKTLIPVATLLLALQGLGEVLRSVLVLMRDEEPR